MLRALLDLRAQVRACPQAADRETIPEVKRRHAAHAFAPAQLAEQLQRERFVIEASIPDCRTSRSYSWYGRILADALD